MCQYILVLIRNPLKGLRVKQLSENPLKERVVLWYHPRFHEGAIKKQKVLKDIFSTSIYLIRMCVINKIFIKRKRFVTLCKFHTKTPLSSKNLSKILGLLISLLQNRK